MKLKKLGWNVAKIGAGVVGSVFGGPGTGMLAAAGMEGLHTAASSDRRKEWKKDPLKNTVTTGLSVGAAGLAGTDAVKGAIGIGKKATTGTQEVAKIALSEGAKNAGGASVDVATNTASKALSETAKSGVSKVNLIDPVSKTVANDTITAGGEVTKNVPGAVSKLTKWDKISKGANIASLGVNTFMNLKGLKDLN